MTGGRREAILPRAFPAGPGRCPAPAPSEATLTPSHGTRVGAARLTPRDTAHVHAHTEETTLSAGQGRATRTPSHKAPEKVRRPLPSPVQPQSGEREGLLGTQTQHGVSSGELCPKAAGPQGPRPTHCSGGGADLESKERRTESVLKHYQTMTVDSCKILGKRISLLLSSYGTVSTIYCG